MWSNVRGHADIKKCVPLVVFEALFFEAFCFRLLHSAVSTRLLPLGWFGLGLEWALCPRLPPISMRGRTGCRRGIARRGGSSGEGEQGRGK